MSDRPCHVCLRNRALLNSDWCRACWQAWYASAALATARVKE